MNGPLLCGFNVPGVNGLSHPLSVNWNGGKLATSSVIINVNHLVLLSKSSK